MNLKNLSTEDINMIDFLNYSFLQEALLVALILSIGGSLLSPFLVLSNQGLLPHSLSHVSFTGYALGLLFFDEPLIIAIPFVIASSLVINYIKSKTNIPADSSIGIITSISIALGLIIIKSSTSFNVSIESLLVGNVFTLRPGDILLSIIILILLVIFILKFYKPLLLLTFDPDFSTFFNKKIFLLKSLLSTLTSIFIVIGVRSIGILLISSLILFPSSISIQISKSFKKTIFYGIIVSALCSTLGIIISHPLNFPASSTIVVIYTLFFIISKILSKVINKNA